ncbi:MAG: nucleotidyltransferase domain-containing protein [Nanoarchaeota archaeon]
MFAIAGKRLSKTLKKKDLNKISAFLYPMVKKYTYLKAFLNDPSKQVNLQEFENMFKKPHQTVKRHLQVFVKDDVLTEMRMGKFMFYKLNRENPLHLNYLSICEKELTFTFLKNTLFKRLHETLSPFFGTSAMLIFGSAAVSKTFNDIDLLVLGDDKKIPATLKDFEKIYAKKIHLVQTKEKDLTPSFKAEIMKKHIILNNHDYFMRILYG